MSIANAETKDLIPLNQAVRTEIPGAPSILTTWRWVTRGLAPADDSEPRIKLSVLYVGNKPFTTRKAIRDFIDHATQARLARMARMARTHGTHTAASRRRHHRRTQSGRSDGAPMMDGTLSVLLGAVLLHFMVGAIARTQDRRK